MDMTDQELADAFRAGYAALDRIRTELERRGYFVMVDIFYDDRESEAGSGGLARGVIEITKSTRVSL